MMVTRAEHEAHYRGTVAGLVLGGLLGFGLGVLVVALAVRL